MTFWLIVVILTNDGSFLEKSSYEAASKEQCVEMAGQEAKKLVNTQNMVQFHCVSDDHYMGRNVDKDVPLD